MHCLWQKNEIRGGWMAVYGKPTPKQLELINKYSKRELSEDEVFVFSDKLVGDMVIPKRFMKLHRQTLERFKENVNEGLPLLIDHSWVASMFGGKAAIPYGRVINGRIKKGDAEGETWALHSDVYLPRGVDIEGVSTDSLISSIETGTMVDSSIAWMAETWNCSVCKSDIRRCDHMPGETYEGELCYADIRPPAEMIENSLVFSGAYPTAGALSSIDVKEDNLDEVLDIKDVHPESNVYCTFSKKGGVYIYEAHNKKHKNHKKGGINDMSDRGKEEVEQSEEIKDKELEVKQSEEIKGQELEVKEEETKHDFLVLDSEGESVTYSYKTEELSDGTILTKIQTDSHAATEGAPEEENNEYISESKVEEELGSKISAEKLLKLAKDGMVYREDLIEETIKAGIRAHGNEFPEQSWRQLLSEPQRTIEAIKEFRNMFNKSAEDIIPEGRATKSKKQDKKQDEDPDEAFVD